MLKRYDAGRRYLCIYIGAGRRSLFIKRTHTFYLLRIEGSPCPQPMPRAGVKLISDGAWRSRRIAKIVGKKLLFFDRIVLNVLYNEIT